MKNLKGMPIMLVGGAGFIGHNMALSLKAAGADVSVVDGLEVNNLLTFQTSSSNSQDNKLYRRIIQQRLDLLCDNDIPLHVQDARDYHAMSRLIDITKPAVLVHLAAVAHANRSNKDQFSTFDHSLPKP